MKKLILNWIIKSKKNQEVNNENFKKILLETSWQLGDCVINSSLLESLAIKTSNIDVIVRENSMEMLKYYPYIKNIFPYRSHKNKILRYINRIVFAIRNRNKYDVIISFENEINTFHLLWLKILNGKFLMSLNKKEKYGIKKEDIKIIDYYFKDKQDILKKLGIDNINYNYKVYLGEYEEVAKDYFDNSKINVIFNYIGSTENRVLKPKEVEDILKILVEDSKIDLYVSSTPQKYHQTEEIVTNLNKDNLKVLPKTKNIFEISSYIKYSDIVVSVDTSLIHIASAYNKKILGFYLNNEELLKIVKPKCDNYFIVKSKCKERIEDLNLERIEDKFKNLVKLIR